MLEVLLSLHDNCEEGGKEILIIRRQQIYWRETKDAVLARL